MKSLLIISEPVEITFFLPKTGEFSAWPKIIIFIHSPSSACLPTFEMQFEHIPKF